MQSVKLIGFTSIVSAKSGRAFTKAYVIYTDDDEKTKGQACRDVFLNGSPLTEQMIGKSVNLVFDVGTGKVKGIKAA